MNKYVTLEELRLQLSKIIDEIDKKMDRYVVTRHGKPAAVFMSFDDLEGLLETIEIMQDKALVRRLRKAEREVRQGKTIPLEEIRSRVDRK